MAKITAPVEDFGGIVADVQFVKGVAEVGDDSEYLRYFVEAGYTVESGEEQPDEAPPEPAPVQEPAPSEPAPVQEPAAAEPKKK